MVADCSCAVSAPLAGLECGRRMRAVAARNLGAAIALLLLAAVAGACGGGPDSARFDGVPSASSTAVLVTYGDDPSAFGAWQIPPDGDVSHVVVLIHGGFFRIRGGDLNLMTDVADDLVASGFAVWNIEYGRVGEGRGGWPFTYEHVGAAVDHVADLAEGEGVSDPQVAVVGHSAGAHLGAWSTGRALLSLGDPGHGAEVVPEFALGFGAIHDIRLAGADRLGNAAVVDLLDGVPADRPDRYGVAGVSGPCVLAVHGSGDDVVPRRLADRLERGPVERIVDVEGEGHLAGLDPSSATWTAVVALLDDWRQNGGCPSG